MKLAAAKRLRWALPAFLILAGVVLYVGWPHLVADPEAQVESLIGLLGLEPGMIAAEVGAGEGRMSVILAQRLGPTGRVFSTELDSGKLEKIRKAAPPNLTALRAGEKNTNLPEECCDAIFLRRVYHHLTDPAAINADLFQALRPGGKMAIIDFSPSWIIRHGVPREIVIDAVTKAGFILDRRIDNWPGRDYCLVFRKPVTSSTGS